MTIIVVFGAWLIGSLVFGLILGRVFSGFARRRHIEEDLFQRIDDAKSATGSRGHWRRTDPIALHRCLGAAKCDASFPVVSLHLPGVLEWFLLQDSHPRGRMIQ